MEEDKGTLNDWEVHPSCVSAYRWLNELVVADPMRYTLLKGAIASNAMTGNRMAQICYGTMKRIDEEKPVSDRYLLGLCWFLRELVDKLGEENVKAEQPRVKETAERSKKRKKNIKSN